MSSFLELPPELHICIISMLTSDDCRSLVSCCRYLCSWKEYAWRRVELQPSPPHTLIRTLKLLRTALFSDARLGPMISELCIRISPSREYITAGHVGDVYQLDLILAKILSLASGLRTFVLDETPHQRGEYIQTFKSISALPCLEIISLSWVYVPQTDMLPVVSKKLKRLIVLWEDRLDIESLLREQLCLQHLELSCPIDLGSAPSLYLIWGSLESLSMSIEYSRGAAQEWSEWQELLLRASVGPLQLFGQILAHHISAMRWFTKAEDGVDGRP